MLPQYIGPIIVIAVNAPLAAWALARRPRHPAYRTFALMGVGLVMWVLGGQTPDQGGEAIWVRLSFLGLMLATASFLSLALVARRETSVRGWAHLWAYLPALALGVALPVHSLAGAPAEFSVSVGSYAMSAFGAVTFWAVLGLYLAAAVAVAWRESLRASALAAERGGWRMMNELPTGRQFIRRGRDWPFRLVMLPLAAGVLLVVAGASLRGSGVGVGLWIMPFSQYAMYAMMRHRLVDLHAAAWRTRVALAGLIMAACLLLAAGLWDLVNLRVVSQELGFLAVVILLSLLVLYAALLPRLEGYLHRLRRRP